MWMIEWYRVLYTHFECSYCPIFPLPWDPKSPWNRGHLRKNDHFPKKSNFWKSAISKTVPNIPTYHQNAVNILDETFMAFWQDTIHSFFTFTSSEMFHQLRPPHLKHIMPGPPKTIKNPYFSDGFSRVSTAKKTGFVRASKSRTLSKTCGKTIFSNCATGF